MDYCLHFVGFCCFSFLITWKHLPYILYECFKQLLAVLVGDHKTAKIGMELHTKINWLCVCLNHQAAIPLYFSGVGHFDTDSENYIKKSNCACRNVGQPLFLQVETTNRKSGHFCGDQWISM